MTLACASGVAVLLLLVSPAGSAQLPSLFGIGAAVYTVPVAVIGASLLSAVPMVLIQDSCRELEMGAARQVLHLQTALYVALLVMLGGGLTFVATVADVSWTVLLRNFLGSAAVSMLVYPWLRQLSWVAPVAYAATCAVAGREADGRPQQWAVALETRTGPGEALTVGILLLAGLATMIVFMRQPTQPE